MSRSEAEERIAWRRWIMSLPGGVDWLLAISRAENFNERRIGPRHYEWPRGDR